MKRFFLSAIALATVAIGCTKSGLLESPKTYEDPIEFEPYSGKAPVTKATEATSETLKEQGFYIIGYTEVGDKGDDNTTTLANEYMRRSVLWGKPTSTDTGDNRWYYANSAYWPDGQDLSFMAYGLNVNEDEDEDIFVESTQTPLQFSYTVENEVANHKDLVISPLMANQRKSKDPVQVRLYHVLSRVGFKVKTTGDANVNVIIKDVRLKGTGLKSANFTLTNAVVKTTSDATTTISYANDATIVAGDDVTPVTGTATIDYSLFDTEYEHTTYSYNHTSNKNDRATPYPAFIMRSGASATTAEIGANTTFKTSIEITENGESKTVDYDPAYISADDISRLTSNDDRFMMVIPQTMSNAKVEVVYQLSGAEEKKAEITLGNYAFNAGKAYEFIFTVSTTAVSFGVEVGNWEPKNSNEVTTPIEKPIPLS